MNRLIIAAITLTALFTLDAYANKGPSATISGPNNTIVIHANANKGTISPEIYGHFAEHLGRCVYEGFWVGPNSTIPNTRGIRNDVVEALKKINVPVIRWPGGCFADEYHWKDGVGPAEQRPSSVNTYWGMVTETNRFGTHEFMDLCGMLGCTPYISGNVGSGTPEEMQDWVEYMTFAGKSRMADLRRANGREKPWKVKYFAVGNENWGCGGNMTPEYYADVFKRYATYVRNYPGNNVTKVACGPGGADYHWLDVLLSKAAGQMDAISMHYYVFASSDWNKKGSATDFDETGWFKVLKNTLQLDGILKKAKEVMAKYDKPGRIGLFVDEWGTWWDVEKGENPGFLYQQNTLRDAVVAGCFLNIFNQHCDRVRMANIAQTNNVLQAMVLTKGEKMIVTPTYYVFEMYKVHQGAQFLPCDINSNPYQNGSESLAGISASASKDKSGKIHISICNLNPQSPAELVCAFEGFRAQKVTGRILTAEVMNAHNTFEKPDAVRPVEFKGMEAKDGKILATIPQKAVVVLEAE
ncbi:MAG: alpha-N-arabinofuranosidase [Sedimentisphaerales bacterium]|jgi:alpha-N-arabinofuranosidase